MKRTPFRTSVRFAVLVAAISFIVGGVFDSSTVFLNQTSWYIGILVVYLIVCVGVVFDMLGLAAAAARETPFHAMASKRVFGAKRAIVILRNAEKVSSICSDVIGDVAGILSGAGSLAVATQLVRSMQVTGLWRELVVIAITALVTALTVGLKAIGKTIAIQSPTPIILFASRVWETASVLTKRRRT